MRYESVRFGYMLTAASIVLVLGAPRIVAAEDETQASIPNGQIPVATPTSPYTINW